MALTRKLLSLLFLQIVEALRDRVLDSIGPAGVASSRVTASPAGPSMTRIDDDISDLAEIHARAEGIHEVS